MSLPALIHRAGRPVALSLVAVVATLMASPALAEKRRPVVREIDLLVALIDADVPVAAWTIVDGPYGRYAAAVSQRQAAWLAQPPLQRPITRPAEIDSLRREQHRRAEQLRGDQRTLIAELRGVLFEHVAERGLVDAAFAEDLPIWLEARMAARVVTATRDGMIARTPVPSTAGMRLSPTERRELNAALRPQLRRYIDAAERFFDAHLLRSPAALPLMKLARNGFVLRP